MKKALILVLVLLMATSSVAFASDNASIANNDPDSILAANELVELSLLMRGSAEKVKSENFWFWDFCEKEMNVKFDVEAVDSSVFLEKLNIIMSTDSMPDMVMASATTWQDQIMEWGQLDELLLPIDEYAEYCPKYMAEIGKQPDLVNMVTCPNGHQYGFSNIRVVNEGQSMGIPTYVNTEWLDRLGMEMPTTLDEFYNMLIAFRDNDANGDGDPTNEIPWEASFSSGYPERMVIMWAYGYNGYRWDEVDSTTMEGYFAPYCPHYKDAIEFLKKCWDEGLIQDTAFSGDNNSNTAYGQTNTDYTYYGFSIDMGRTGLTGNKDLWSSYSAQMPLVVDDTITRTTWKGMPIDLFTWIISASTEYPEVCVKFCDAWYDPYMAILYGNGPEYGTEYDYYGTGWVYDPETQSISYPGKTDESVSNDEYNHAHNTIMDGANFGLEGSTAATYYYEDYAWNKGWDEEETRWQQTLAENNTPYEMYEYFDNIYKTPEDQEFFNTYKTPLQNYMVAQESLFISGERDWSEFDDYMAELDAMGGQEFNQFLKTKMAEYFASVKTDE